MFEDIDVELTIDDLMDMAIAGGWTPEQPRLPDDVMEELIICPETVIGFLLYLADRKPEKKEPRTTVLLCLIDECFTQIRYGFDRKDSEIQEIFEDVKQILKHIYGDLRHEFRLAINEMLFEAKLPIGVLVDEDDESTASLDPAMIMPKLPEMLEKLRRDHGFQNAFELFQLLVPQMQVFPEATQLTLIADMALSKKSIAHELAVLMLLHPIEAIRKQVPGMLLNLTEQKVFTPVDLRRLICLRNWVPEPERPGIDTLIQTLRGNKLQTAPHSSPKITQILGSPMDGAGAAIIAFEVKHQNKRHTAGFVIKLDVGIKDSWVMLKTPKNYVEEVFSENKEIEVKPVSKKYVSKIVQHFLFEGMTNGNVPTPEFLQVAELFGTSDWHPSALNWGNEIKRLESKYHDKISKAWTQSKLEETDSWHRQHRLAEHWFDIGDHTEQVIIDAAELHRKNPTLSLEEISTRCLMKVTLERWKLIFLINCLCLRSKEIDSRADNLYCVLSCLDQGYDPASIPLLRSITTRSVANVIRREQYA